MFIRIAPDKTALLKPLELLYRTLDRGSSIFLVVLITALSRMDQERNIYGMVVKWLWNPIFRTSKFLLFMNLDDCSLL